MTALVESTDVAPGYRARRTLPCGSRPYAS